MRHGVVCRHLRMALEHCSSGVMLSSQLPHARKHARNTQQV